MSSGVPQAPSTPGGASQEPISPHEEAKTTPETVAEKLSDVRTEPLPKSPSDEALDGSPKASTGASISRIMVS